MCGYLEWNLNVEGKEVADFEARIRAEHGAMAVARASSSGGSSGGPSFISTPVHAYPTPETTPDPARPIRPVPSPYRSRPSYRDQPAPAQTFPSPPSSPHHAYHLSPPHFASANSSLASSPASDDCKTPSPVAVTQPPSSHRSKGIDASFTRRHVYAHHPITAGAW